MKIEKIIKNNTEIASIIARGIVIKDIKTAIDLMMNVKYEMGIKNIAIPKDAIINEFFVLSSGIAGEILQKVVNYQFRIAIYGDFSVYTSKPLKDFIFESNKGNTIFFVDSLESAISKLSNN